MCGIIGYLGSREAAPILFEGLKKLEYRGYDSCGIATLNNNNIFLKKDAGKINAVNEKHNLNSLPGNIGIGHTRWATHGKVNKENAHPIFSNSGNFAIVQNGIVENYQELKNNQDANNFEVEFDNNNNKVTETKFIPDDVSEEKVVKTENHIQSTQKHILETENYVQDDEPSKVMLVIK